MSCVRVDSILRAAALSVLSIAAASSLVAAPRPELLISPQQLEARLGEPDLLILHVGADRESFDGGHIPGAQFLPWEVVARTVEGVPNEFPPVGELAEKLRSLGLSETSSVVLYDAARGLPSTRAFVALEHLALSRPAAVLDGQWAAWLAEERPVERGGPKERPVAKRPLAAAKASPVVHGDELRRALTAGKPQLIDARSSAEYSGEKAGRDVSPGRGGHLPGASHVAWDEHLVPGEVPYLRPAAELHGLYDGLEAGKPVVTYCRTGVKASHTYFVLRYLGFEPKLYDGSFIAWHRDPEAPVVKGEGASEK